MRDSLLYNLFVHAGWVRFPLGFCAVLALGIILYRLFTLYRIQEAENAAFERLSAGLLNRDDRVLEDAALSAAPVTQILRSVSALRGASEDAMTQAGDIALAMQRLRLRRYLGTLATIGSTSPFIGLFGTVLGVMQAFQSMGQTGMNEQAIALGISEALSATALGLLVAIPSVMAYNFMLGRVQSLLLEIHGHVARLIPLLRPHPHALHYNGAGTATDNTGYDNIPNAPTLMTPRQEG